jgi:peptidoglycan hydrolase-like protein with peptidoglycan-binding domain
MRTGPMMTPNALRFGLLSFVVLTGALATNVFVLQPPVRPMAGLATTGTSTSVAESGIPSGRGVIVEPLETGTLKPAAEAGDRTSLTRAIQRELKGKGYETGAIDGVAGLVTRGAIMAYESDSGLPLTGEPRADLLQHLVLGSARLEPSAAEALSTPPTPAAESVIRAAQRALRQLGYLSGDSDGRLNAETIRAIRRFEADRKLSETGRISGELLAKLASVAGDALRTQ